MKKIKKYPLLISIIISFAIIIASLFVLGFAGMNMGVSFGGGSQFEVNVPTGVKTKDFVADIKSALKDSGYTFDSSSVEDKFVAIDDEGNFTKQVVVVRISQNNLTEIQKAELVKKVATVLNVDESFVSPAENIIAQTTAKNVLSLGIAIGIVAAALFVFAWVRYDIFAGLSFIIAFLHNIILNLSLTIVTRLELSLFSLTMVFIFTLIMSIVLIHIYENYRKESRLHISDKLTVSERMINGEIRAAKPFVIIAVAVVIISIFMLFAPLAAVKFMALSILLALIVTAYTSLVVGPASYVALLDIRETRRNAILSRNDTINKVIKKKIKNSQKSKTEELKEEVIEEDKTQKQKEVRVKTNKVEDNSEIKKNVKKTSSSTNKYATRKNTKKKK